MIKILSTLKKAGIIYLKVVGLVLAIVLVIGLVKKSGSPSGTYVEGSIDKNGHYRKGHFRKDVSTDPNAMRNQARSKYYYESKGKYLR